MDAVDALGYSVELCDIVMLIYFSKVYIGRIIAYGSNVILVEFPITRPHSLRITHYVLPVDGHYRTVVKVTTPYPGTPLQIGDHVAIRQGAAFVGEGIIERFTSKFVYLNGNRRKSAKYLVKI